MSAFDQVEGAPAGEQHPEVRPPRRGEPALPSTPSVVSVIADGDEDPRGEVEEAVHECVLLQSGDGVGRVLARAGEHVVPLEDLVKHDAVDEPAEADPQQERGGSWRALRGMDEPGQGACGA